MEKYVLEFGEGDKKEEYLIERVIPYGEQFFFTLFNLMTGDFY